MNIVLLGAPGAGKGTLASALKESFDLLHVSTGDILREEMKNETDIGKEAKKYVESGGLVPDEIVIKLIEKKLMSADNAQSGYMLDGFPRNKQQAQALDTILAKIEKPIDTAVYLESTIDVILQRLTGRRLCKDCGAVYHITNMPPKKEGICDSCGGKNLYQRADDNEETIKTRMDVFMENTMPIVDYYKEQGKLVQIDADKSSDEVQESAKRLLSNE